jgi:hypothetical protein
VVYWDSLLPSSSIPHTRRLIRSTNSNLKSLYDLHVYQNLGTCGEELLASCLGTDPAPTTNLGLLVNLHHLRNYLTRAQRQLSLERPRFLFAHFTKKTFRYILINCLAFLTAQEIRQTKSRNTQRVVVGGKGTQTK